MWPFKSKKRDIEYNIGKLHSIFGLCTFVMIAVFFAGGNNFIQANAKDVVYFSLGLLTFVSVFFSFVYSDPLTKFESRFQESICQVENKIKNKVNGKMDSSKYRDIAEELEQIESLKKKVKPKRGLFISVICYLLVIISFMINTDNLIVNNSARLIMSVIFHIGMTFTLYLVASIMALSTIYNKEGGIKNK